MARFAAAALFAAIMAQTASAVNVFTIKPADCPAGWSANTGNNNDPHTYCCPGSSHIENGGGYCCVDTSNDDYSSSSSSSGDGDILSDDFFSDSGAFVTRVKRQSSCTASVDFSDPDYTSKVSSLSKSLHASSTQDSGDAPASNTAVTTGSSPTSTGSSDGGDDGDDSESAKGQDSAASSTTNSDNAAAMPTAEILGGVLAVAAAFAL